MLGSFPLLFKLMDERFIVVLLGFNFYYFLEKPKSQLQLYKAQADWYRLTSGFPRTANAWCTLAVFVLALENRFIFEKTESETNCYFKSTTIWFRLVSSVLGGESALPAQWIRSWYYQSWRPKQTRSLLCPNEGTPDNSRARSCSCCGGGMCSMHIKNIKKYWAVKCVCVCS